MNEVLDTTRKLWVGSGDTHPPIDEDFEETVAAPEEPAQFAEEFNDMLRWETEGGC